MKIKVYFNKSILFHFKTNIYKINKQLIIMKKILICIALIIAITSCKQESKQTYTISDNLKIELLINFDSTYKPGLYRFRDGSISDKYFVIGNGSTYSREYYDKGQYNEKLIQTINK